MLGSGEKFGKQDANIAKGMLVDEAVMWIMKAMHLKKNEFILGSLFDQFVPIMLQSTAFSNWMAERYYKKQLKTKSKAE